MLYVNNLILIRRIVCHVIVVFLLVGQQRMKLFAVIRRKAVNLAIIISKKAEGFLLDL